MWPMLLDYSREECKRILRRLELEAYSSIVSAFRAQGELTKEKKKLLHDLSATLSISTERHRAEIRRAVNDEKLNTVAEIMGGPGTAPDWAIEGRRLIPLMPRLVPQTAFSPVANSTAEATLQQNANLPPPHATGHKRVKTCTEPAKHSSPVVNGSSNQDGNDVETPVKSKKHRKIPEQVSHHKSPQNVASSQHSSENNNAVSPNLGGTTRTVSIPMGANPIKITLSSTAGPKSTATTTTARSNSPLSLSSQKVILVSTSGTSLSPSILQRSLSIPVVKTVSATKTTVSTGQSKFAPSSVVASPSTPSSVTTASKPSTRPRTVTIPARGKSKQQNIVIPVGTGQQSSLKNVPGRSGVQVKPDGSLKIITRTVPSNKLLPKSSTSGISRGISFSATSGGPRVVNVSQGSLGITTSSGDANVVVVNAKTLQGGQLKLESVAASNAVRQAVHQAMAAGGIRSNSNVIVVKQSQLFSSSGSIMGHVVYSGQKSVTAGDNASVKTVISPSDQSLLKSVTVTSTSHEQSKPRTASTTASSFGTEVKATGSKPNTLLADLMQATGIIYDNEGSVNEDSTSQQVPAVTVHSPNQIMKTGKINSPIKNSGDGSVKDSWIEYDNISNEKTEANTDNSVNQIVLPKSEANSFIHPQIVTTKSPVNQIPQALNLDQIPEGSVFEINSPEVAELLNQGGGLSSENTIKILKQAGFEITSHSNDQNIMVKTEEMIKTPSASTETPGDKSKAQEKPILSFTDTPNIILPTSKKNKTEKQKKVSESILVNDKPIISTKTFSAKQKESLSKQNVFISKETRSPIKSCSTKYDVKHHEKFDTESQTTAIIKNPEPIEISKKVELTEIIQNSSTDVSTKQLEIDKSALEIQQHQAFLEEVVKGIEKQEQLNELMTDDSKTLNVAIKESVVNDSTANELEKKLSEGHMKDTLSLASEVDTSVVTDNELKENTGNLENKQNTLASAVAFEKGIDHTDMEIDAFQFVDEMLEQNFPTSCSGGSADAKSTDKKPDGTSKPTFIRLQDLDESKMQKVKIHQLSLSGSTYPDVATPSVPTDASNLCQNLESQEVKSSIQEIVLTPVSNLDTELENNVFVSVTINSSSSLSDLGILTQSSANQLIVGSKPDNFDFTSITPSSFFNVTSNLPLISSDQNFAITEVTKSVTSPMMVSQIIQPSENSQVVENLINDNLKTIAGVESNALNVESIKTSFSSNVVLENSVVTPASSEEPTVYASVSSIDQSLFHSNSKISDAILSTGEAIVNVSTVHKKSENSLESLQNDSTNIKTSEPTFKIAQIPDPCHSSSIIINDQTVRPNERISSVSSTSGKPSSSTDVLSVSSTSCDLSAHALKLQSNLDSNADSTCDNNAVGESGNNSSDVVDSTSVEKLPTVFESVDSTSSSTDLCNSLQEKAVGSNLTREYSPGGENANVDSTSVMRQSISLTTNIDSMSDQLKNVEASEAIDSTTNTCQLIVNTPPDDGSCNVGPSDSTVIECSDNSNQCPVQISPTPRICPAPTNFMISNSRENEVPMSFGSKIDAERYPKNVTVEQETIDTTNMKFEDYASQKIKCDEKLSELSSFSGNQPDSDPEPSTSSASTTSPVTDESKSQLSNIKTSEPYSAPVDQAVDTPVKVKRKRKLSDMLHQGTYTGHVASWVRSAMGLVQRVSKFRGSSRTKSDQDAAHWFLSPVSEEDVPDYYNIIKEPMDFSTIKTKLENGQYANICDFHNDMLLVKKNCETYNPPKHPACLDCEEVFAFYLSEYEKLMEKWQRSHILSSPKRSKNS